MKITMLHSKNRKKKEEFKPKNTNKRQSKENKEDKWPTKPNKKN